MESCGTREYRLLAKETGRFLEEPQVGFRKGQGNALLLVILLMLVLGLTLNATVRLTQSSAYKASTYHHRVSTELLADACLLAALNELEKDPDWVAGFDREKLGDQQGHFSLHFYTDLSGLPGPEESVNNLKGTTARNGPQGPGTVAPGTAHLVAVAEAGPVRKVVQTIYYRPRVEDFVTTNAGLVSEGATRISGNIDVYGVSSMSSPDRIPAGLHANGRGADPSVTTLAWNSSVGDTAEVSGTMSTTAGQVDLGGGAANITGGTATGEDRIPPPDIDISREVRLRASLPSGGLSDGVGETSMGSGEFYVGGDVTMNGDLILNDSTIYVRGDLFVNGTIKGTGSVFVDGDTSFYGDAIVSESNLVGVAVFSEGYVQLSGFSGETFMNALAAGNPSVGTAWDKARSDVLNIYQTMEGLGGGSDDGDDAVRDWLDGGGGSSFPTLRAVIAPIPGETARFLEEKFDHLSSRFAPGDDGFFEELSEPDGAGPNGAMAFLERISYDKLGYSFFQGIVYTNAGMAIQNEVEVLGSVWATGNAQTSPILVDGFLLNPGDIVMNHGAKVVLVSEYGRSMEDVHFGSPVMTAWYER